MATRIPQNPFSVSRFGNFSILRIVNGGGVAVAKVSIGFCPLSRVIKSAPRAGENATFPAISARNVRLAKRAGEFYNRYERLENVIDSRLAYRKISSF